MSVSISCESTDQPRTMPARPGPPSHGGLSAVVEHRPYQSAAIATVRKHWAAGRRRVVVALPTGAGKTVIGAALLAGAARPLVLVPSRELADQTRERIPGATVLTYQAASRPRRLATLAAHDAVFLDECHHAAAGRWCGILGALAPAALVVGVTATPERADGAPLGDLFSALVATAPYSHLLRRGWISPCAVRLAEGEDPAAAYLAHGQRRPGIVAVRTVAEGRRVVTALMAEGVRASTVDSTMRAAARKAAVEGFRAGTLDVLVSPMALAEGFDAPRAEVAVLGRTLEHAGTYLQWVGRVLRPAPGKRGALVIDCTGATERHGHPTADREYSLAGNGKGGGAIRAVRPPAARRLASFAAAVVETISRELFPFRLWRAVRSLF